MKLPALLAGAALAASLSLPAVAQELRFSGHGSVVSNLMWRGVSLSDNDPAAQIGGEVQFGGFFGGLDVSSVNINGDDVRFDARVGHRWEMGQSTIDVGYVRYIYDDSGDAGGDFYGALRIEDGTRTYTGALALNDDMNFADANLGVAWEFVPSTTLSATVGRAAGDVNYGSVGMGYAFSEALNVEAGYYMTNQQRNRLTVGLSTNF